MVIRDLATDTGPKPSSDIRSMGAVLDDLIAPDLAFTLITMYAASSFTNRTMNNHSPVFSSITVGGFFLTLSVSQLSFSVE
jgi:hypothetical protein